MKYDCRGSRWYMKIVDAINNARNGDTLVLATDAARSLAKIARDRMRPGLSLKFEVKK